MDQSAVLTYTVTPEIAKYLEDIATTAASHYRRLDVSLHIEAGILAGMAHAALWAFENGYESCIIMLEEPSEETSTSSDS